MSGPGSAGKNEAGGAVDAPQPVAANAVEPGSAALRAPRVPQFDPRVVAARTGLPEQRTTLVQARAIEPVELESPVPNLAIASEADLPQGDPSLADGSDATVSSEPIQITSPSEAELEPNTGGDAAASGAAEPALPDKAERESGKRAAGGRRGKRVLWAPPPKRPVLNRQPPGRPAQRLLGTVVDGRYVVEGILGEGGMGVVYLCRRTVIDKLVAMKVLHAELMNDAEVVERFQTEAKAASAIGSPHIVEVFDFGELPDGSTYFVMEHLDGLSLTELIVREAPLGPERVIHISRQIAEGLGAAHDAGIVHRDLKPDNLILVKFMRQEEFVKILDFGIAKMARAQNRVTRAGSVFGTPQYMSPEQASGAQVDHRTDVYALGVIMYELLAGQVPFDGESPMGILSRHVHAEVIPLHLLDPPPQQEIPPGLEAIVQKCLSKDPDHRYPTMQALADDLDRVEHGLSPRALVELAEREAIGGAPRSAGSDDLTPAYSYGAVSDETDGPREEAVRGREPATMMGAGLGSSPRATGERERLMDPPSVRRLSSSGARRVEESRAIARSLRLLGGQSGAGSEWTGSSGGVARAAAWGLIGAALVGTLAVGWAYWVVPSMTSPPAASSIAVAEEPSALAALAPPTQQMDASTLLRPEPQATQDEVEVQILVFPFRAHVWRDGVDLGETPVTVHVTRGSATKFEARSQGTYKRTFLVDGSRPRVEVRLAPAVQDGPGKPNDPGGPGAAHRTSSAPPPQDEHRLRAEGEGDPASAAPPMDEPKANPTALPAPPAPPIQPPTGRTVPSDPSVEDEAPTE